MKKKQSKQSSRNSCSITFSFNFTFTKKYNFPSVPVPPKFYSNSDTYKAQILSENKNKSGIYMFKNSINGKRYIGSSVDLRERMYQYFNNNHLRCWLL